MGVFDLTHFALLLKKNTRGEAILSNCCSFACTHTCTSPQITGYKPNSTVTPCIINKPVQWATFTGYRVESIITVIKVQK